MTAAREHGIRAHIAHGSLADKLDDCPTGLGGSVLAIGVFCREGMRPFTPGPGALHLRCPRSESVTSRGAGFACNRFYPAARRGTGPPHFSISGRGWKVFAGRAHLLPARGVYILPYLKDLWKAGASMKPIVDPAGGRAAHMHGVGAV